MIQILSPQDILFYVFDGFFADLRNCMQVMIICALKARVSKTWILKFTWFWEKKTIEDKNVLGEYYVCHSEVCASVNSETSVDLKTTC